MHGVRYHVSIGGQLQHDPGVAWQTRSNGSGVSPKSLGRPICNSDSSRGWGWRGQGLAGGRLSGRGIGCAVFADWCEAV